MISDVSYVYDFFREGSYETLYPYQVDILNIL